MIRSDFRHMYNVSNLEHISPPQKSPFCMFWINQISRELNHTVSASAVRRQWDISQSLAEEMTELIHTPVVYRHIQLHVT